MIFCNQLKISPLRIFAETCFHFCKWKTLCPSKLQRFCRKCAKKTKAHTCVRARVSNFIAFLVYFLLNFCKKLLVSLLHLQKMCFYFCKKKSISAKPL